MPLDNIVETSTEEESDGDVEKKAAPPKRKPSCLQFTAPPMPKLKEAHHQMFVELYDLDWEAGTGQAVWQETARWIKYEEDAEGLDHHWGRPHVAFLSFHALHQLKACLTHGLILLDLEVDSFDDACEQISGAMARRFSMDKGRTSAVLSTLKRKRRRVHNMHRSFPKIPSIGRNMSVTALNDKDMRPPAMSLKRQRLSSPQGLGDMKTLPADAPRRKGSVLGIPPFVADLSLSIEEGTESAQVFVGTLSELRDARFCMVRLKEAVHMPELLEAPVPIRFLFVILGPAIEDVNYHEIGRSIATLMSNPHFHSMAYSAPSAEQISVAIDAFLDDSIVIPPGEIDSKQLLSVDEIKKVLKMRNNRTEETKKRLKERVMSQETENTELDNESDTSERGDPLARTGRLFGGLRDDLRCRLPWYWSDIRDALNPQCLSAILFMFFAAFAPAITFGGLMSNYTEDMMGITETLLAQCLCGVIWGVFSAQPLTVVSITGPVLIFEASLFTFSTALGLNFLTLRIWTGFWVFVIALITVMFEGSFLVSYVTEYSEDIFSILISIIFIKETIKFIIKTFTKNPVAELGFYSRSRFDCDGMNTTLNISSYMGEGSCDSLDSYCCSKNQPDTAVTTLLLLLLTLALAVALKRLRSSALLGRTLRRGCGDLGVSWTITRVGWHESGFPVLVAILVVGLCDHLLVPGTYIQKLYMPPTLDYTSRAARNASVLIPPLLGAGQWWGYLFAVVPALLVYILLFVETEITELLLAKPERGLRKGTGYHWNLLLIAFLAFLCSLFGLPWMCAAAVESLGHASSLTVMKRSAPGERHRVDYVIEQRVTVIVSALLVGSCAFLGSFLSLIPMATIYGIFLYLGLMSISSVPLVKRMKLLFVPEKYFPNKPYCTEVGMWRMHLWTMSQVVCLAGVYTIKHFQESSLGFPFALATVAAIRLFLIPRIFTETEITALDGHDHAEDENEEEVFPYSVF